MRILFDHSVPRGVARSLSGHLVTRAKDRGWDTLSNGNLLAAAELDGFDLLLTADKNMRHQQNLTGRRIALVCVEYSAMAACSIAPGKYCGGGERRFAGQLC